MSQLFYKERDAFGKFMVEKSKNVTAPFIFRELCSEFKRESGTPDSEKELKRQTWYIGFYISGLKTLDTDTKVKMLFGLSAPVDYKFLAELREEADVEVDEYNRITKYEKKGEDGFQLIGIHNSQAPWFPCDTVGKMLKFLAEISQTRVTLMTDEDFLEEFAKSTNSTKTKSHLEYCYNFTKDYIHIATEIDVPTRVKMLFVSGAEVNDFFRRSLQDDADVFVDEKNRITNYKAADGSLVLNSLNTSFTHSGRLSKKLNSTADFFTDNGDDQFFRNRRRRSRQQHLKNKQSDAVVDDDSSTTSSNNSNIGGNVSDDDNDVKVSEKKENEEDAKNATSAITLTPKIPVPSSRSCSSPQKDDDVEFDAPTNEDNEVAAQTSDSTNISTKSARSVDSIPKTVKIPSEISTVLDNSSDQHGGKKNGKQGSDPVETKLAAPNTKNEKKDLNSSLDSGSSSKVDIKENKIVSKEKNGDNGDSKKDTKSVDSTPKMQKTSAEKSTVPDISKTENGGKSNIKNAADPVKNISTSKIDDNKGSKTVQKEKNVVKITPKVYSEKRKLVSSASESTASKIAKKSAESDSKDPSKGTQEIGESQEDVIYEGFGDLPLPIPLVQHKTEEMEYQEEQVDRFVAYRPNEFGNSQFLPEYPHDNDVKLEEMDALEAIRDVFFAPVNSSLPVENQGIEMTNSEDILKVLRSLVRSLGSPMVELRENSKKNLQDFIEKIDNAMEKMKVEDHKVPSDEMMTILNASLQIVMKSVPSPSSSEDSASLQLYLWTLRSILIAFSIPALNGFQETVNENLRELEGQDKMVSIERIRRSLETVVALAIS